MLPDPVLSDTFRRASHRTVVVDGERVYSGSDLAARFENLRHALTTRSGSCVICASSDPADVLASICLPGEAGMSVLFVPGYLARDVPRLAASVGASAVVCSGEVDLLSRRHEAQSVSGEVLLLTSGTSGTPKVARHKWQTLLARIRRPRTEEERVWLLTYLPTSFAGLQVLLTALVCGDQIVRAPRAPREVLALATQRRVTHLSCTPTFLRGLMAAGADGSLLPSFKQITLGGEIADQRTLTAARTRFPGARISHIYAATETGALFSVGDGLEGFPRIWLENGVEDVRLKLVDDVLYVNSPRAMVAYAGRPDVSAWIDTGDMVSVGEDRVLFVGRRDRRINVGGAKTVPEEVEQAIMEVPGVADAVVTGMPNPLSGQMVLAEVVPEPGSDTEMLREEIFSHIRGRLANHQIPRILRFRSEVPLAPSGKKGGTISSSL